MTMAFTTKIAIIGWGSLIWDLDDLAPKVTEICAKVGDA